MKLRVDIRSIERPRDDAGVGSLETTYYTEQIFHVVSNGKGLRLEIVELESAREHSFPLNLDEDPWTDGWVAVSDGCIVGFIATALDTNRRLVIWHFYVAEPYRRQGIGRGLMATALLEGARRGAVSAWVETGSSNSHAVAAYRCLGFELSGFDWSHHRRRGGEFALFLSKDLSARGWNE